MVSKFLTVTREPKTQDTKDAIIIITVHRHLSKLSAFLLVTIIGLGIGLYFRDPFHNPLFRHSYSPRPPDFSHLANHCANAQPIPPSEFHYRQKRLAKQLHALNTSAYIAEPGANAQFFGNLSLDVWHLSERPLLLIISPQIVNEEVEANITVLTPSFEASRAKLLSIPSASGVSYAEWPEEADPYKVAVSALPSLTSANGASGGNTIFVDEAIRHFLVDGFEKATLHESRVLSAPQEIRYIRERKSQAEIELMKCANEVTLLAIRTVHSHITFGHSESQVNLMMENALSAAGLKNIWTLVLFGENAALPHGSGTDKILTEGDFVLIDAGGTLNGYNSDVTRTFALPEARVPVDHLRLWHQVLEAQNIARDTARSGLETSTVDDSARKYLTNLGYGKAFTHRLGHGIGLETHEQPYLRGGSKDIIQSGHAFSNEPGVYIEGQIGIRLEDCFYIDESGLPVFFTAGVGGQAKSPWLP